MRQEPEGRWYKVVLESVPTVGKGGAVPLTTNRRQQRAQQRVFPPEGWRELGYLSPPPGPISRSQGLLPGELFNLQPEEDPAGSAKIPQVPTKHEFLLDDCETASIR